MSAQNAQQLQAELQTAQSELSAAKSNTAKGKAQDKIDEIQAKIAALPKQTAAKPEKKEAIITSQALLMKMPKSLYRQADTSFQDLRHYANMNVEFLKIDNTMKSGNTGNFMFVAKEWQGENDAKPQVGKIYLSVKQVYFMAAKCGKLIDGNGDEIAPNDIAGLPDETIMEVTDMDFTPTVKILATDKRWDIDYNA